MIYLDNAATTMHKPPEVMQAVMNAMCSMGNASRGAHAAALGTSRIIYEARETLADFFGCSRSDHVVFTANVTQSLNIVLRGILSPGDHVVSTQLEHNAVLRPLYHLAAQGVETDLISADSRGRIRYEDFEAAIRPNTKVIVCTHASNLTGNMLDIQRIGDIAHRHGLYMIVDAAQTAGVKSIDMRRTPIDVLCFTGHKGLMGPQGTGGLCIREGVEIRPLLFGGTGVHSYDMGQPKDYPARLEAGTLNGHGIAGLLASVRYIQETGLQTIDQKEQQLMKRFYDGIRHTEGITVYGDIGAQLEIPDRAAIVSVNVRDYDAGMVADELSEIYGIAVRAGAHCAPLMHRALGTQRQGAVRFSFSWFNTGEEADLAAEALRELAK